MISLFDLFLLSVALAMDCFTVSIMSGVILRRPVSGAILRMALLFGLFQAAMPLIGWFGTAYFSHYVEAIDHWIAFGLLVFIGGKMVKDSFQKDDDHRSFNPLSLNTQVLLAVATSIDALAVGVSMACLGYEHASPLPLPLTMIGVVSFIFSPLGYVLGGRFGRMIAHRLRPELVGGLVLIFIGCKVLVTHLMEGPRDTKHYTHEVLNRMTPIKNQGDSQTCWIYAMLAAIETEHLRWGDSVNLSAAYVEKKLMEEPQAPKSKRGMGATLLSLIQKHGVVGYDAMRHVDTPVPRFVFMLGMEYTPQEFARSVCAPDEYVCLTSTSKAPYYKEVEIDEPDNWLHQRFLNVPMDTLLSKTVRAVRSHHGICWESRGYAMAIVGIAHDDDGKKYFIMKNSWGTARSHKGLEYLPFSKFRSTTLAVEMSKNAYDNP